MKPALKYTTAGQDADVEWAEGATIETVGECQSAALDSLKSLAEAVRELDKIAQERDETIRDLKSELESAQADLKKLETT